METRYGEIKNIHEILAKLNNAASTTDDKRHLKKLEEMLFAKNYKSARELITLKMNEGFFKSTYQKLLADVIPHITIASAEDHDRRLLKLMAAIKSTGKKDKEFKQVKNALDSGGLIVVNETFFNNAIHHFQYEESVLIEALKTKNKDLINYLIAQGVSAEKIVDKGNILNKNNETALHIACELKMYELIPSLIDPKSINAKRNDGLTPLFIACFNNDFALVKLLINKGADPSETIELESGKPLSPFLMMLHKKQLSIAQLMVEKSDDLLLEGDTLLHLACNNKFYDIIPELLTKININTPGYNQMTPLFIACRNNDTNLAIELLKQGADPNLKAFEESYQKNASPFLLALANKNLFLAKEILKYLKSDYKINSDELVAAEKLDTELYEILKAPIRERRKKIKDEGPIIVRNGDENSNYKNLMTIFGRTYVENAKQRNDIEIGLKDIYDDKNEILKPLLELVSLAARGNHLIMNPKNKKLKILVTDEMNVYAITASEAAGLYRQKNTVYIASRHGDISKTLGTILHELQHFAEHQIFGIDKDKPLYANDEFIKIKKNLRKKTIPLIDKNISVQDKEIYKSIRNIFAYDPGMQDFEILVKVPEILGRIGVKAGYQWLLDHEPQLLKFYETNFIPACKTYLEEKKKEGIKLEPVNDPEFNAAQIKKKT